MPSYLVTGASRGLGLGFVTRLLQNKENTVIATARDTAGAHSLQKLKAQDKHGQLKLIDLDVSKVESIRTAADQTAKILPAGLDHLINNAGISGSGPLKTFDELNPEELELEVSFPIISLLLVLREFLPLISKSEAKKILVISSIMGSITVSPNMVDLGNGYSIARAALNMMVGKWGASLKSKGVTIAVVHPGWVDSTDMGSSITPWFEKNPTGLKSITVEESAAGVVKVLQSLTIEDAGSFFNYDGTPLPW